MPCLKTIKFEFGNIILKHKFVCMQYPQVLNLSNIPRNYLIEFSNVSLIGFFFLSFFPSFLLSLPPPLSLSFLNFKTGSLYVVLTVLELSTWTRMSLTPNNPLASAS
jgi:hypothetical protein